ncbi:hypothetical protein CLOBAR_01375 [Intestinibacter bartlettii DSM 16795]|nr:hypothetical protein CLOBAR_01375 [Intestinibacter bartlettii DSM 16795]
MLQIHIYYTINEDINIDNIVNIRSNYVKLLYYKKSILEGAY